MLRKKLLAFSAGAAVLALAGCGGTTTNSSLYPNSDGDPFISGLSAAKAVGGVYLEESGLSPSIGSNVGYLTTATASTAVPIPAITIGSTIPLGFAPGAFLLGIDSGNNIVGTAAPASSTVVFRAAVTNGQKGGVVTPIVPTSLVLTSPEDATLNKPLTFDSADIGSGAWPNGQYNSAPFTLPFSTSGLHTLKATVSDTAGRTTSTTFETVVLKPSDSAILVEVTDADGNALPGATATITNPVSGATAQTTADAQGVVVLFAAPGSQTVTATKAGKTATGTFTLTAGQLSAVDSTGNPLTVATP
jgi:hypothetical protein